MFEAISITRSVPYRIWVNQMSGSKIVIQQYFPENGSMSTFWMKSKLPIDNQYNNKRIELFVIIK